MIERITDPHGEWNPYYINLSGEYSANDTRMTVYSAEVDRQVPFDKDIAKNYPKTAAIYKVGTQEYANLEEQYPSNRGLIKNIVYPVDIKRAIAANNFELLAYDDSFLEINERESIVTALKDFLDMVRVRWWVPEYQYEDMYALTFWAMMWQMMPAVLLTQRFKNIKTPNVHSFHVWEYLKSRGISDYRDVLTTRQALWLYRNIDYIQGNLGKQGTLEKLASNLLGEAALSLQVKDMHVKIGSKWNSSLLTEPHFISAAIGTNDVAIEENFSDLTRKLYSQGLDTISSTDEITAEENKLGIVSYNKLNTKFLELKKDAVNTSRLPTMAKFFLDTLFAAIKNKKMSYVVNVTDIITGNVAKADISDVVLLWYYCLQRSVDSTPTVIPHMYNFTYAWKQSPRPELKIFQEASVKLEHVNYPICEKINLETMLSIIPWNPKQFTSPELWMTYLVDAYGAYSTIDRRVKLSSNQVYHFAMEKFYSLTREHQGVAAVEVSRYQTYSEWLSHQPVFESWIDAIELSTDKYTLYEKLAVNCYNSIFDTGAVESDIIATPANMETIYTAIRDLFISLGSYNVTYLETVRGAGDTLEIFDCDFLMGHHEALDWGVPDYGGDGDDGDDGSDGDGDGDGDNGGSGGDGGEEGGGSGGEEGGGGSGGGTEGGGGTTDPDKPPKPPKPDKPNKPKPPKPSKPSGGTVSSFANSLYIDDMKHNAMDNHAIADDGLDRDVDLDIEVLSSKDGAVDSCIIDLTLLNKQEDTNNMSSITNLNAHEISKNYVVTTTVDISFNLTLNSED